MKNQKPMVNQKFFRQKVAKLSKQHSLAILVKAMGLGFWAWTCPYWDSTAIHIGHAGPMAPIPDQRWFSDGPSLIMKKIQRKIVQVESWHVHVVKTKVKSHERQLSTEQEKQWKWPERTESQDRKCQQTKQTRPELDNITKKQEKNLVCDEQLDDKLTPLFDRLNAVNTATFPVERR